MAVSNMTEKLKAASAGAPVQRPAAPTTAPGANAVSKKGSAMGDAFKQKGQQIRNAMSEDQKAAECSKSGTITFVGAISDPTKKTNRKTTEGYVESNTLVGYKFRLGEDTVLPVAPFEEGARTPVSVDKSAIGKRAGKAGEEVILNIVEAAMLAARVEYSGFFTGGGVEVYLTQASSKNGKEPTPCFRMKGASIKEKMDDIAVKGADGSYQIRPEYANQPCKLENLLVKRRASAGRGAGSASSAGETIKDTAAAFRALYGIQ